MHSPLVIYRIQLLTIVSYLRAGRRCRRRVSDGFRQDSLHMAGRHRSEIAGTESPGRVRHMQALRKSKSAGHFANTRALASGSRDRTYAETHWCVRGCVRALRVCRLAPSSLAAAYPSVFCLFYCASQHTLWAKHFECHRS